MRRDVRRTFDEEFDEPPSRERAPALPLRPSLDRIRAHALVRYDVTGVGRAVEQVWEVDDGRRCDEPAMLASSSDGGGERVSAAAAVGAQGSTARGFLSILWKIDKSSIFKAHLAQLFYINFCKSI